MKNLFSFSYAELSKQHIPEDTLINIRTPKWPYVDHRHCVSEGNMRNSKNSIFPESALINIRPPKRADIDHRPCVLEGNMRNSK